LGSRRWGGIGLGAALAAGTCLTACEPSSRGAPAGNRTPSAVDVGHVPDAPASTPSSALPSPSASADRGPAVPHWIGRWRSASCGERAYERWLELDTNGTFAADDRVSPCPPKVTCVWSGIVHRTGSYQVSADDRQLALHETSASTGPKLSPLPTELAWDPAASAPVESSSGARCVYERR
jgi:hypothetical protein